MFGSFRMRRRPEMHCEWSANDVLVARRGEMTSLALRTDERRTAEGQETEP